MQDRMRRLRTLLEEQETFPMDFTVKFIGRNTEEFNRGVAAFETRISGLTLQSRRESSGNAHLALTYVLAAKSPDAVVQALEEAARIPDVTVIL